MKITLSKVGNSHDIIIGSTFKEIRRKIHLRKSEYDQIETSGNPYNLPRIATILDGLRYYEKALRTRQNTHYRTRRDTLTPDEYYTARAAPHLAHLRDLAAKEYNRRRLNPSPDKPLTHPFNFRLDNVDFEATIDLGKHSIYLVARTTPFFIYKHVMFPRYDILVLLDNPEHYLMHPYFNPRIVATARSML